MDRKELKEELKDRFKILVDKDFDNYYLFQCAFDEFIGILAEQDLSEETTRYLYDMFIKDMKIYFKYKNAGKEELKKQAISPIILQEEMVNTPLYLDYNEDEIMKFLNKCNNCKFTACEQCEINYKMMTNIKSMILDLKGQNRAYIRQLNGAFDNGFIHKDVIRKEADLLSDIGEDSAARFMLNLIGE